MIEVRVTPADIVKLPVTESFGLGRAFEFHVLTRLREAGAPVTGHLLPKLTRGRLERFEDLDTQTIVFRWCE